MAKKVSFKADAAISGEGSAKRRQSIAVANALKQALHREGVRNRDIAERLGVGIATVKRWLSGQGLTVDRLEDLCELASLTMAELVEQASAPNVSIHLTLRQERELIAEDLLGFLFFSLLNGWPPDVFQREFEVSDELMSDYLNRLWRLGLIELSGSGRVRPMTGRRIIWRPGGPMARHFEKHIKPLFVGMDFGAPDALYVSDIAKLSPAGVRQIASLMERVRIEFRQIADADRKDTATTRQWHALLFLARPLELSAVRRQSGSRETDP